MHTDKPKVLHVIARYNVGGTARYLSNLLPQLNSEMETLLAVGHVQGHEIEDSTLENIEFVRIEHLGRRINLLQDIRAYLDLRKTVKKFKPQIIHSHTFKAGLLCRLMYLRIPKVHTFHGHLMGDPEFSRRALQVIVNIERRLARLTNKLITVGEQVSKDLIQVGIGKPSQYVSIASEGKKLIFLDRNLARENLNLDQESPIILWMARMAPVKNPSLALEVARLLPDIRFLMAGGGELFNQIKDHAPPNTRLLGWVDAAEVIPSADVFLSTSLNEGIPYSLLEVLSAGIPVVAVESGAISEIIQDKVNGFLTSKDPAEIAAQLAELVSKPALRNAASEFALSSSGISDQMKKMAPAHIQVYNYILIEKT